MIVGAPQPRLDLAFSTARAQIPQEHGYALFGSLCSILSELHGAEWLAVHPLRGRPSPGGMLELAAGGDNLILRVAPSRIPDLLPLIGEVLSVNGCPISLGQARVRALQPAPCLSARLVTIKGYTEPASFCEVIRRHVARLQGDCQVEITRRRVLLIGGKRVVGFGVALHGLTADASHALQCSGIGGRQHFGCGVLTPMEPCFSHGDGARHEQSAG